VTLQRSKRAKTFVTHIDKVKHYLANPPKSWLEDNAIPTDSVTDSFDQQQNITVPLISYGPDTVRTEAEDSSGEEEIVTDETDSPDQQDNAEGEQSGDEITIETLPHSLDPVRRQEDRSSGSRPEETSQDFAVDEGPQPRPKREKRLPARYRD